MSTLDLPFLWVEIVGTVPDVLFPSQRHLAVSNQHITLGGGLKADSLPPCEDSGWHLRRTVLLAGKPLY